MRYFKCLILLLFSLNLLAQNAVPIDTIKITKPQKEKRISAIFLPAVTHSIETSWTFGAATSTTFKQKDSLTRTSNLQVLGLYSLKNQIVAAVSGTYYFPKEKYILTLETSFNRFPDKFWGIGNKTPNANEERYSYKQFYIYPHLQRRVFSRLYVGVLYEFQKLFDVEYGKSFLDNGKTISLFDEQNVVGRYGSIVSGLGFSVTWDTRTSAFSPSSGLFAQVKYNNFNKVIGSQFRYQNFWIDVRKFLPLSSKTVLALQGIAFLNKGDVPLRSLATLGGNNNMRGYYDGRYRDKNQLVFQAEYRFPIYWRFSGVGFASFGDVSDKVNNFQVSNFKHSYGTGIRFAVNPKEKLNIRIDYGWGQNKASGLYFYLGEAF